MKKILFVEDEIRFQKMIEDLFRVEGFELLSAYDGESGLRMAREKSPDLILLDLILPKRNGFEVLEELKNDQQLSKIPVIILTNLEGVRDVERAFSLGARTYLVKANYSVSDILEKIKEVFKENESRASTT
ncbi:response regulator [Patescibacteria group bacterium]|nr:response regulator [Patescibacteria group bacterium]MBU4353517.1 response regulator [Patescibacteria group bacterium]MBU4477431.1 response regulator [Patescibacteria group bacterium]MCG2699406.1 response regulator [Candidatus Parcubacteria bacterium]